MTINRESTCNNLTTLLERTAIRSWLGCTRLLAAAQQEHYAATSSPVNWLLSNNTASPSKSAATSPKPRPTRILARSLRNGTERQVYLREFIHQIQLVRDRADWTVQIQFVF